MDVPVPERGREADGAIARGRIRGVIGRIIRPRFCQRLKWSSVPLICVSLFVGWVNVAIASPGSVLAVVRWDYNSQRVSLVSVGIDQQGRRSIRAIPLHGLTPVPFGGPALSPDGHRAIFAAFTMRSGHALFSADLQGHGVHMISGTRGASDPVISRRGRWLAFTRSRLTSGELPFWWTRQFVRSETSVWLLNRATGADREIVPWQAGVWASASSFSPAGAAVAISRESAKVHQVRVTPLTPGSTPSLLNGVTDAAFSPSTRREVALIRAAPVEGGSMEEPSRKLELQTASGSRDFLADVGAVQAGPPAWSPTGDSIAYIGPDAADRPEAGSELFITGLDGSCPIRIGIAAQLGPGRLYGPAWAGSGAKLAITRSARWRDLGGRGEACRSASH